MWTPAGAASDGGRRRWASIVPSTRPSRSAACRIFEALIVGTIFCDGFASSRPLILGHQETTSTPTRSRCEGLRPDDHVTSWCTRRATSADCCRWTRSLRRPWKDPELPGRASAADAQHIIADGPYKVRATSHGGAASTRTLRGRRARHPVPRPRQRDQVSETGTQESVHQQLQTNTASAGM